MSPWVEGCLPPHGRSGSQRGQHRRRADAAQRRKTNERGGTIHIPGVNNSHTWQDATPCSRRTPPRRFRTACPDLPVAASLRSFRNSGVGPDARASTALLKDPEESVSSSARTACICSWVPSRLRRSAVADWERSAVTDQRTAVSCAAPSGNVRWQCLHDQDGACQSNKHTETSVTLTVGEGTGVREGQG